MRYSAVGWVGLAILLGLLGFLGYRQLQQADTAIDGAPPGGSFVLQGAAGDVSLTDFRGKLVLIYFGYSFCPDICPMSLSAITMAFNRLAPEELAQVQGIFVSVDPARDSVERVEQYAKHFHPQIVGLTGSEDAVKEVAGRYGVFYQKVELSDSAMGYAMDHSSMIYLVNRVGDLQSIIYDSHSPEALLAEIRKEL